MGKLLQSRSRLLSELCPGGAGRPIELGIFIPHPLRPSAPQLHSVGALYMYGGLRRYGGTVVLRCWYGRNIALIRRRSQELPVGQLFKFRPQRWDCYLYGTHEDATRSNKQERGDYLTPLFLPYSAYLRYLKYLCLLKVLEVLLVFEVYRWVSFLSSYHLGKFRYFWFLRSVEYFYRFSLLLPGTLG